MRPTARAFTLVGVLALACGAEAEDPGAAGGDAGTDAAVDGAVTEPPWDAAGPSDGSVPEPDAAPVTTAYDPCGSGTCWTAPVVGGLCGPRTINENFASGLYNVHRYVLLVPANVDVVLTAQSTGGNWQPTLVVHDEQGITVHDGELSHSGGGLTVETLSGGAGAATASTRLRSTTYRHVGVYLSDRSVVQGQFAPSISTDAAYTFEAQVDCTQGGPIPGPLTVRGVQLTVRQELWVRYMAQHVVPKLPGSAAERFDKAAYVAWWALKEGVINVNNPLSYSNCSIPPDKHIGPVEVCPNENNAWQVGLSGVQAAYRTLASVEAIALKVYPEKSSDQVALEAGMAAGFGASTTLGQTIAESSERLRLSWLLRDSAVGFEAQYPPVYNECFVSEKSWCFGTGWGATAAFAPNRAGAEQSIADLKALFQALAP